MRKYCLGFFVYFFLIVIVVTLLPCGVSYAHHKRQVLGEATVASELEFPRVVTSGPGFILPDSPLYFLDGFVQGVRLAVAFTPEQKAKVRAQIAGERLAELRLMLADDDQKGIQTALNNLTKETAMAARSLQDAAATGKDVKPLAKELNETIKTQRDVLGTLINQSDGSLRLRLKAAREEIKLAKVEVEDELPDDLLEQEIENGLEDEVEEGVEEAENNAVDIEHDLLELEKQATKAAEQELQRREEAIEKAIQQKNEQLLKTRERELEFTKKSQEKIDEAQKLKFEQAKRTVQEAREAAKKFEEAKREEEKVKQEVQKEEDKRDSESGSRSDDSSDEDN